MGPEKELCFQGSPKCEPHTRRNRSADGVYMCLCVLPQGLHPVAVLLPPPGYTVGSRGLPAPLAEWLEVQVGGWVVPLVTCAALAAGIVAAAWQLRTWWAAQLAMVRPDDVLAEAAASRTAAACAVGRGAGQGAAEGSGTAAAPAEGPFSRLIPAALRAFIEPTWKPTDK